MQINLNGKYLTITDEDGKKYSFFVKDLSKFEYLLTKYIVLDSGGSIIVGKVETPVASPAGGTYDSA